MPGELDGQELIFTVRDKGENIPIIVVSGWVDDEAAEHQLDCVYTVIKNSFRTNCF